MQILQVTRRQRHRGLERVVRIRDAVMRFVVRPQALEDLERLRFGRLQHVDLLEAARQRAIAIERLLHVGERGRADAAQRADASAGFSRLPGVHRAARRRAGADQRVDLVDEQNGVLFFDSRRAPA